MTSPEIRRIVDEVYAGPLQLPPQWTRAQREDFLESAAARISLQVAQLAAEMGAAAVGEWTHTHGSHPDYLTKVGLLNNASSQAMEIVLTNELYEKIPSPPEEPSDLWGAPDPTTTDRSEVPWDQRWTQPQYRSDPSEDLESLIADLWPDPGHSAVFRIKAGYLLAARAEDGLDLPSGPNEDLSAQLAAMVYRDLREDGLPEH